MSSTGLAAKQLDQAVARPWQPGAIHTVIQMLLLIGIGGVAALAKRIEPSLGIPGSSAPLWLGTLVAGRAIVRRNGGGTVMGVALALWGIPIGLHNSLLFNIGLYGFTGVALDLASRLPKMNLTNPLSALVCGASAHMVKFLFIVGAAYAATVSKHFLVVGLVKSALLHLGFGAGAGLVGWGAYMLWSRMRRTRLPDRR